MATSSWVLAAILIIGAAIICCDCQSNGKKKNILLKYKNVLKENGYSFEYKTEDSQREENGDFDVTKGETGGLFVTGFYQFKLKKSDPQIYRVDYVADKNGYRAKVSTQEDEFVTRQVDEVVGTLTITTLIGGGIG